MQHAQSRMLVLLALITGGCCAATPPPSLSSANIIAASRDNCVRIRAADQPIGSGFFIGQTHVATCCHVVTARAVLDSGQNRFEWAAHSNLVVECPNGQKIRATCISVPTSNDISPFVYDFAVLRLEEQPKDAAPAFPLSGWRKSPQIGAEVYFSGYPLATPAMLTHKGMVSGVTADQNIICIEAPINKGNSGGALINENLEIIGIVSMREGGISKGLDDLRKYIASTEGHGSISMFGVDPLQSTKEIVDVLDAYISTGIGYAITTKYLSEYLERTKLLQGK